MAVCSRDVKAVACDRCFFMHGFRLCLWLCKGVEGITYQVIHSSVHGKHDGETFGYVGLDYKKCNKMEFEKMGYVWFSQIISDYIICWQSTPALGIEIVHLISYKDTQLAQYKAKQS